MGYCQKCGNQIEEKMTFCPRCGAPLKAQAYGQYSHRHEKGEKSEKGEKQEKGEKREKQEPEKGEKHEKGEIAFVSWLVGGLILICVGALAFLNIQYHFLTGPMGWALILLVIGVIIIFAAIYFAMTGKKRNPRPV